MLNYRLPNPRCSRVKAIIRNECSDRRGLRAAIERFRPRDAKPFTRFANLSKPDVYLESAL